MSQLIDIIKKYAPDTYPVSGVRLDDLNEPSQDEYLLSTNAQIVLGERSNTHDVEKIKNVIDEDIKFTRQTSYFKYFLDGCRRSYYICDMATSAGGMVPIIVGQISAAVTKRIRTTGKVELHKYKRQSIFLLPVGGRGINKDDAEEIKVIVEKNFIDMSMLVVPVTIKDDEAPQDSSLAKLNAEMQKMEISFLEEMTSNAELSQDNMVVVDGALQFTSINKNSMHNLRYAVGIAKHFNLHLTDNIIGRKKEIGTLLVKLRNVGDRTPAYKLIMNDKKFAFWYLRIRPFEQMNNPHAGVIKLEKLLVTDEEREDGLDSDVIDNISRCSLLETSVCPFGNDFRWASHIYPIYLTEQVQKKKYLSDYYFTTLLRRQIK